MLIAHRSIGMGRASPPMLRVSSPFNTTGERESLPLPAGHAVSPKSKLPQPGKGRKWPGGVPAEAKNEAKWTGQDHTEAR